MADKSDCGGSAVWKGPAKDLENCAENCKGVSTMFVFGTNDWGTNRCDPEGCACFCATAANPDGTCSINEHNGYRLFKYEKGKLS